MIRLLSADEKGGRSEVDESMEFKEIRDVRSLWGKIIKKNLI